MRCLCKRNCVRVIVSDIYLQSFRTMFVTVQLELQLLQFMLKYLKKKKCYVTTEIRKNISF